MKRSLESFPKAGSFSGETKEGDPVNETSPLLGESDPDSASFNETSPLFSVQKQDDVIDSDSANPSFGGRASTFDVGMNIGNTIIGSGIIGLPYAVKEAGFVLGVILLLLVSFLTIFSLNILVQAGVRKRLYHYPDLFEGAFGKVGFYVMNLVLLLNSGGGCISYLIIVGDTIPTVLGYYFPDTILGDRQLMVLICALAFVFPLLLFRDLGYLAKFSLLSVTCIPFIVITVAVRAFSGPAYGDDREVKITFANPGFFRAIGTMAFAYVCHQASFLHFRSLRQPNLKTWGNAVLIGVLLATVLSVGFGVIGFLAFGEETKGNILSNFPEDDLMINIARIFLALTMFLTFPFAFAVIRLSTNKLIGIENEEKSPTTFQHIAITVVLFAIILPLGIFLTDLGIVYEIIGGLCSVSIAYIMPAACFLMFFGLDWKSITSVSVLISLLFGIVAMTASTGTVIYGLIVDEGNSTDPGFR